MIYKLLANDIDDFACLRECSIENNIGIEICKSFYLNDGSINTDNIVILKLDEHPNFNSSHTHNPPAMIDLLIFVQCCDGKTIDVYLVEIRKTSDSRKPTNRLKVAEVFPKFKNAIDLYLTTRCSEFIQPDQHGKLKAYLVCDPWSQRSLPNGDDLFAKKMALSALDAFSSMKPIKVFNRYVQIEPKLPNPLVTPC